MKKLSLQEMAFQDTNHGAEPEHWVALMVPNQVCEETLVEAEMLSEQKGEAGRALHGCSGMDTATSPGDASSGPQRTFSSRGLKS
jgi:hypothetical protein